MKTIEAIRAIRAILALTLKKLVIWLYTLIFTVCLPLVFLRLAFKSRKNPGYRYRWLERLGLFPSPPSDKTNGLWIHAVSVGETVAAGPLILALQKQFPHLPITVTTTTPTGSDRAKLLFKESVFHVYFPYDHPFTINAFLNRLKPRICIFMETELWPNVLRALKHRHVPCIIANGRLSNKSMKGYETFSFLTRDMLKNIEHVAAQSEQDGARFVHLGLDKKRLSIVGNIKFDVTLPSSITETANALRRQWGESRPVWIAASTHAGEESDILWVFSELKKETEFSDLMLILVPRHPERFQSVADEIEKWGFRYCRRSHESLSDASLSDASLSHGYLSHKSLSHESLNQRQICSSETEIFLGDTMGELPLFYGASTIAFVGGSLVPIGGHNTLEPAALGLPSVVGPFTHNFSDITHLLKETGALFQIHNKAELLSTLKTLLRDKEYIQAAGLKGKQAVLKNQGATQKIIKLVQPTITRAV